MANCTRRNYTTHKRAYVKPFRTNTRILERRALDSVAPILGTYSRYIYVEDIRRVSTCVHLTVLLRGTQVKRRKFRSGFALQWKLCVCHRRADLVTYRCWVCVMTLRGRIVSDDAYTDALEPPELAVCLSVVSVATSSLFVVYLIFRYFKIFGWIFIGALVHINIAKCKIYVARIFFYDTHTQKPTRFLALRLAFYMWRKLFIRSLLWFLRVYSLLLCKNCGRKKNVCGQKSYSDTRVLTRICSANGRWTTTSMTATFSTCFLNARTHTLYLMISVTCSKFNSL